MKFFLVFLWLLCPLFASAKTFTLTDDVTKETYLCSSVTPQKTEEPAKGSDPDCIAKITKLCRERGGKADTACFELATRRCRDTSAKYADCVKSATQTCVDTSSGSPANCLDRSLRECK